MTNDTNAFPELNGTLEVATNGKKWYAIRTKSRCEKKLAKCAYKNNIEYYLPLVERFKEYPSEKVNFLKVLITGYVFVKSLNNENETLIKTGYTANFLSVRNQEEFVSDLMRIHSVKNKNYRLEETAFVKEGYLVEITAGALIGLTGIVENVENPERIIVTVSVINKAVSIGLSRDKFKIIH